ncbi:MAG: tRNA pseudouridine(13) synthase TruD [Candidatus Methanofastidiosa archaeon]|nr:tRNA pseudouridine(13) synthase TruD [Candidatus Methanofastidiosa archaeon]
MIIKHCPKEFTVRERSIVCHKKDDCIVATIEKVDWDTTLLVKEMAKALAISQKSVGYAGLKDKTSASVQKFSFYGVPEEKVLSLNIPGVEVKDVERGDRINIGDLEGNEFDIVVRKIKRPKPELGKDIQKGLDRFSEWHGFINYFGYQRFGLQRPVTAEVGKLIVKKDYEGAALTYIGKPYPLDPMSEVRREFLDDMDFKKAYEAFPQGLRYERAMLFSLAHEGKDFKDCFKALPERLLKLFVHAYQSKLFNEIVKRRIEDVPPNVAEIGDHIIMDRYERKATTMVNRSNIERVSRMIEGEISVSAPLIGSRTILPNSTIGSIAKEIMEREELDFKDFENHTFRPFDSSGTQREILARYSDLRYEVLDDEIYGSTRCDLGFFLKKGQYATEYLAQLLGEEALPERIDDT